MLRIRFEQILRYLHLSDSAQQICANHPGYDPLFKVRNYLDLITDGCEAVYNLGESISIDEAMIPFKGRLFFKQYMKTRYKGVCFSGCEIWVCQVLSDIHR